MTNHYLALVFIGAGNAHCIRDTRSMAVVEVLREVQSSFGTYFNLSEQWIDVNLYDASKHRNFVWNERGVWGHNGYDAYEDERECLYEAGLRLPTLEVQMPKLRKNGSVWSKSYEIKLMKATAEAFERCEQLAK